MSERDAKELLGMLGAKVQHFSAAPGGVPTLLPEDVAYALGMMRDEGAALLARVKYAGEIERAEELVRVLFRRVALELPIGRWRVPRRDFIRDLCRLALVETIDPQTCLWCGGTGRVVHEERMIVCGACHNGKRRVRDADRAALMGCIKSSWSQHWADRYEDIRCIVDRWDDMLGGALRNRLKRA